MTLSRDWTTAMRDDMIGLASIYLLFQKLAHVVSRNSSNSRTPGSALNLFPTFLCVNAGSGAKLIHDNAENPH